jgi:hypothetical protein
MVGMLVRVANPLYGPCYWHAGETL